MKKMRESRDSGCARADVSTRPRRLPVSAAAAARGAANARNVAATQSPARLRWRRFGCANASDSAVPLPVSVRRKRPAAVRSTRDSRAMRRARGAIARSHSEAEEVLSMLTRSTDCWRRRVRSARLPLLECRNTGRLRCGPREKKRRPAEAAVGGATCRCRTRAGEGESRYTRRAGALLRTRGHAPRISDPNSRSDSERSDFCRQSDRVGQSSRAERARRSAGESRRTTRIGCAARVRDPLGRRRARREASARAARGERSGYSSPRRRPHRNLPVRPMYSRGCND